MAFDGKHSTIFFLGYCYSRDGNKVWGNRSGLGHAKARQKRDAVNSKPALSRETSKHVFLLIYSLT